MCCGLAEYEGFNDPYDFTEVIEVDNEGFLTSLLRDCGGGLSGEAIEAATTIIKIDPRFAFLKKLNK